LIDRLKKIATNPFHDWSYTNLANSASDTLTLPIDSTPAIDMAASQNTAEAALLKSGPKKRGRKRIYAMNSEQDPKKIALDSKSNKEKEKEKDGKDEKESKDQIQLQELYYATMEGDKNLILKEHRSSLLFKV